MENCGKTKSEAENSTFDFSFIFKDDKPVIDESQDNEVVTNPMEPIRIEERVRTRKRKDKKKKKRPKKIEFATKNANTPVKKALGMSISQEENNDESKIGNKKKGHSKNKKKKKAPIPVRDMSKFEAQENLMNFGSRDMGSGLL